MDKPRKVLMMTYNFPPWGGGDSIRIRKMVKYLLKLGWETHVLTIDERYIDPDATKDYDLLEEVKGCVIHRTRSLEPSAERKLSIRKTSGIQRDGSIVQRESFSGRVLANLRKNIEPLVLVPDFTVLWMPHAVAAGRRIAREHGIELLFTNCPPYGTLVNSYFLSKAARLKWIIDIKDVWVGSPMYECRTPLRQKMDRAIERKVVENADNVILVTREAFDQYRERFPRRAEHMSLIPNGVDLEDFTHAEIHPKGGFRMLIPGMLDINRNPTPVINVFFDLISEGKLAEDAKLQFIGDIRTDYVESASEKLGEQFEFIRPIPHQKFLQRLGEASAVVVIVNPDISSMVPGKLYEIMASRRRFLVLPGSSAAGRLCREYGYGSPVNPSDKNAIRAFIEEAYNAYNQRDIVTAPPKNLLEHFSREHQTRQLGDLFERTLEQTVEETASAI